MDKLNIIIALLLLIVFLQLQKSAETFITGYDLRILNEFRPKAMKPITKRNLRYHLRTLRAKLEKNLNKSKETSILLKNYNSQDDLYDAFMYLIDFPKAFDIANKISKSSDINISGITQVNEIEETQMN